MRNRRVLQNTALLILLLSQIQNRVSSQVPPMATSAWPITHAALAEVLAVTDNSKLAREMMPAQ